MKNIKTISCIVAGYVGGPTMAVIALKKPQITVNVGKLILSSHEIKGII